MWGEIRGRTIGFWLQIFLSKSIGFLPDIYARGAFRLT